MSDNTPVVAVRGDRRARHFMGFAGAAVLSSAALVAKLGLPGLPMFAQALLLFVPFMAAFLAWIVFHRPALQEADMAAANLRAERDGAREKVARLQSELEKIDGQRGVAESARKAAEKEAAAKADYLATISKEVRTPLTGVTGMAELLTETQLDDEQAALVDTVRQSAEALQEVLSDVMDFADLEAGKVELLDAPFDIVDVAAEALEAHLPAATSKGLELILDVPPGLKSQSRGDAERLGRMVSILVGNAVKFTERGEVVLRLGHRERGGNAEMIVEVADTGIGIAPEDRSKVFAPFVQGDQKAAERYGGTGLGLAIASRLARLMSGRIEVKSSVGEGTVFRVAFPYRMRQTARGQGAAPDLAGRRYLVIDDSSAVRSTLERHLMTWGAGVAAVSGVEEAEDLLWEAGEDEVGFNAVLLDTSLGADDSAAFAARVGEKARGLPILLMASGDPRAAQAAVEDGVASGVLAKPFRPEELAKAIEAAHRNAAPTQRDEDASTVQKAAPSQVGLAPACIVLADDNAANRILIEKFLSDEPMTLIHAPDGVGAVEAWSDWAPDLILMDVSMPRMDGLEATRRIRKLERSEGMARVPIIALTARAMAQDRETCLEAGMDDYVPKPIRKAELKSKITEWTRSRRKSA